MLLTSPPVNNLVVVEVVYDRDFCFRVEARVTDASTQDLPGVVEVLEDLGRNPGRYAWSEPIPRLGEVRSIELPLVAKIPIGWQLPERGLIRDKGRWT